MTYSVDEPPSLTSTTYATSSYRSYLSPNLTGSVSMDTEYRKRTLWKNPDRFTQLKQNGYMPPLPYTGITRKRSLSLGTMALTWPGSPPPKMNTMSNTDYMYCDTGSIQSAGALSDSEVSAAASLATGKCNEQLRSQFMSVLETAAEGKKTLQMCGDIADTIVKAALQVKRGQFTDAAQTLGIRRPKNARKGRSFSSNWLEYRYGVMPLLYEIYGAVEFLANEWRDQEKVYHVKGSGERVRIGQTIVRRSGSTGNHSIYGSYDTITTRRYTYTVTVGYVFKVKNTFLQGAVSLGITNPILTGYNLLTLSFVADWFVNVSDVLGQLDAWVGTTFVTGYRTTKIHSDTQCEAKNPSPSTGYTLASFKGAKGRQIQEQISRVVLSQPPTVGLVLRPKLNWKRLLDAATLLRQFTR